MSNWLLVFKYDAILTHTTVHTHTTHRQPHPLNQGPLRPPVLSSPDTWMYKLSPVLCSLSWILSSLLDLALKTATKTPSPTHRPHPAQKHRCIVSDCAERTEHGTSPTRHTVSPPACWICPTSFPPSRNHRFLALLEILRPMVDRNRILHRLLLSHPVGLRLHSAALEPPAE